MLAGAGGREEGCGNAEEEEGKVVGAASGLAFTVGRTNALGVRSARS